MTPFSNISLLSHDCELVLGYSFLGKYTPGLVSAVLTAPSFILALDYRSKP
jgi:hypothetical protein